jgi:hypothetical protein
MEESESVTPMGEAIEQHLNSAVSAARSGNALDATLHFMEAYSLQKRTEGFLNFTISDELINDFLMSQKIFLSKSELEDLLWKTVEGAAVFDEDD